MKRQLNAITLAVLMCSASVVGYAARPNTKASEKGTAVSLEQVVPKDFGDWRQLTDQAAQVVNPETQQLLDKLYSQLLTRIYVNNDGYRIMLSLAYGDDQRGGLQAHRPEVCYPAQGFKLGQVKDGTLDTAFGKIDVRRITTSLGTRNEPVTYWLTVGDEVAESPLQKRIAQIRLGLTGQIPDGMLFRISSIDPDNAHGFAMQQKFAGDLVSFLSPVARRQLSGLTGAGT